MHSEEASLGRRPTSSPSPSPPSSAAATSSHTTTSTHRHSATASRSSSVLALLLAASHLSTCTATSSILRLPLDSKTTVTSAAGASGLQRAAGIAQSLASTMFEHAHTIYYTSMYVGTPPQKLRVLLDTGSYATWFRAPNCTSIDCKLTYSFDFAKSSSFEPVGTKAPVIEYVGVVGWFLDCLAVNGVVARDTVSATPPNATAGTLTVPKFTFTLADSLEGGTSADIEGILGMSLQPSADVASNATNTMFFQSLMAQNVLDRPMFSVLVNPEYESGELLLGGYDPTTFASPTTTQPDWIPVVDASYHLSPSNRTFRSIGAWALPLTSITTSSPRLPSLTFPAPPSRPYLKPVAIVDTGSNLASLPAPLLSALAAELNGTADGNGGYWVPCEARSSGLGPTVRFNFEGGNGVVVTPAEYVRLIPFAVPASEGNATIGANVTFVDRCFLNFRQAEGARNYIVLGNSVTKRYVTIFDYATPRVGFALARNRTVPFPAQAAPSVPPADATPFYFGEPAAATTATATAGVVVSMATGTAPAGGAGGVQTAAKAKTGGVGRVGGGLCVASVRATVHLAPFLKSKSTFAHDQVRCEDIPVELARRITLHIHPSSLANLLDASTAIRRTFAVGDGERRFVEEHLRAQCGELVATVSSRAVEADVDVPFWRLPDVYAVWWLAKGLVHAASQQASMNVVHYLLGHPLPLAPPPEPGPLRPGNLSGPNLPNAAGSIVVCPQQRAWLNPLATVFDIDSYQQTPLRFLILSGKSSYQAIEYLLNQVGELDSNPRLQPAALVFTAVQMGCPEILALLISYQVPVDALSQMRWDCVENKKCTPLYVAARSNRAGCVEVLIKHGADLNAGSEDGSTPLSVALKNEHVEIARMLVRSGARLKSLRISMQKHPAFIWIEEDVLKSLM
ncbi:hypothetical protein HDU96_003614 [Phlyctochytrium bullatum]|nr:hypothetical protein HDU96_003614 [Phlyctochytrium bullatum]